MKKKKENKNKTWITQKVYFSSTDTLNSWLGGKFEKLIYELRIGKYRISLWESKK